MFLSRFGVLTVLVLGAVFRAEAQPRATPERPAPWVEFMRGDEITAWFDTSRVAGDRTGAVEVTLSIDYDHVMTLTDDTTAKYTRMDWPVALDCAGRRVQDRGMILFDAAGREIRRWEPATAEPWAAMDGHVTQTLTFWACRRLAELGRQPPGDYVPRDP